MKRGNLKKTHNNMWHESEKSEDIDEIVCNEADNNYLNNTSDIDSNFTSISQIGMLKRRIHISDIDSNYFPRGSEKSTSNVSVFNQTSSENKSDGSFLDTMIRGKKSKFLSPQEVSLRKSTPLRLFNRRGKPLTDRTGRTLVDIFGEPLVLFDDKGRTISDSSGNQIFNCAGQSAIHSDTDLRACSDSIEDPGIPIMDYHKKHVLILFDSEGHPMTDSLGRPLLKASGKRMFGMDARNRINVKDFKDNKLKSMYGKAPLENVVRHIQIFSADLEPLTDANGIPFDERRLICNKDGMPICDDIFRTLYFNYGARVVKDPNASSISCSKTGSLSSEEQLSQHLNSAVPDSNVCKTGKFSDDRKSYPGKIPSSTRILLTTNEPHRITNDNLLNDETTDKNSQCEQQNKINENHTEKSLNINLHNKNGIPQKQIGSNSRDSLTKCARPEQIGGTIFNSTRSSNEAIVIYDASKKLENQRSSSTKVGLRNAKKNVNRSITRDFTKRRNALNMIECLKKSLNLTTILKATSQTPQFNQYGKPTRDCYGNALYDKFGIPLTGAHGIRISEKARHALRVKLRNVSPKTQSNAICFTSDSHDDHGECYDKYGRPMYDLFGSLMYDVYGRPLTDAFGRPLVDAIGQPLMDSKGNILTSMTSTDYKDQTLTDIYGRPLHDKYGRPLFDTYGRPRFDIYTNAIYDSCGRPARDANDRVLRDFLGRPIIPHPSEPLYKNARDFLPKYIDKILEIPSMYRVFKFSHTSLIDLFGGPLFDDFGRPLYNKNGKPLYDKYGMPLYDRDGNPLCDCYGRPLSEEIRRSPNDETSSVVDSLKLLKITNESSQWMEIRRSEITGRPSNKKIIDDEMKDFKPLKHKSTKYVYALARATTFKSGRQELEILEAPLSSSTAAIMHRLPIDNKPVFIVARRQHIRREPK